MRECPAGLRAQLREVGALRGHAGWVFSPRFSSDGHKIVSGSADGKIRIWDAVTGACVQTLEDTSRSLVMSVQISPDGQKIVSATSDDRICVWDAVTGECAQTIEKGCVHCEDVDVDWVQFSNDGYQIRSLDMDEIRMWDAVTGKCVQNHKLKWTSQRNYSVPRVQSISPDGQKIVSVEKWPQGRENGIIYIWDAVTGACMQTMKGHTRIVSSAWFSPDGHKIVSGSHDNSVRVWDAVTGECLHTLEGHNSAVRSVQFSPAGDKILSGSQDKTVRIWDAATGECVQTLEGHRGRVTSVRFSPNGQTILSGATDKTVRIW
jgi:WD40 repeat protein